MIRRFKVGYDVELHKRTLERGLLSLIGPDAGGAGRRRRGSREAEHANALVEIDGIAALAVRTDVGVDLLCDGRRRPHALSALLLGARAPDRSASRRPSACASSAGARATESTSTTASSPRRPG